MPRFIPPSCHTKSDAEELLFSRLKKDPKAAGFTVLHSFVVGKNHPTQVQGEIDFVIVMPGRGILVAEVKGAKAIRQEDGEWYFGLRREKGKSPFKQVADNAHALREILRQKYPELVAKCYIHPVVITPYVTNISIETPEWESWEFLGTQAFQSGRSIAQELISVYEQGLSSYAEKAKISPERYPDRTPSVKEANQIVTLLRPSFELVESARSRAGRVEHELLRATKEQSRVLEAIESPAQLLVRGGAGTGKTLLAAQTALRSLNEGRSVLFLCFNRLLAEHINTLCAEQIKNLDNAPKHYLGTFHAYARSILTSEDEESGEIDWKNIVLKAVDALLGQDEPGFDELILDEAQDLLDENYLQLLELSLKGGLKNGRWRLFGDFDHQKVFERENELSIEEVRERLGGNGIINVRLSDNCRNTPRTAAFIEHLCDAPNFYTNCLRPDTEINPSLHFYSSNRPQGEVIKQVCETLRSENYRPEEIVILSMASVEKTRNYIEECGLDDTIVPYSPQNDKSISFSSIRAFKGLEAPAIVLTGIEGLEDADAYADTRDLLYVGLSRSTERVALIAEQRLKDTLTSILSRIRMGVE